MATEQYRLSIVVSAEDLASGKLGKVKSELVGLGKAGPTSAAGITHASAAVERATGRMGAAIGHLKQHIGGLLSGPLGYIGLGAGLLTFAGAIEHSISEAQDLGLAVEKLSGVTGESAQIASSQVVLFQRYGLGVDKAQQIAAFAEKTLGKLDATQAKAGKSTALLALEQQKLNIQLAGGKTKLIDLEIKHQTLIDKQAAAHASLTKLDDLDQKYGLHLRDAKGHVVDFQSELLQVADMYTNKAIPAQEKANVAATLFGRGYVALIPILKLGANGILEAQKSAAALGLTLNASNAGELRDYTANMRSLGEAVHGAMLQIGLAIIPLISDLAKGVTGFLEHGGSQQLVGFFRQGAVFAREMGSAIKTYILPAFSLIAQAWGKVPEPLKQLLIGGVIANKALKMTLGVDPLAAINKGIGGAIGGLAGSIFSRGTPGNPMWVAQAGGGLGGTGGVAGKAGLLAAAVSVGAGILAAAGIITVGGAIANAISPSASTPGSPQWIADQNRRNPWTHIGTGPGSQNVPGRMPTAPAGPWIAPEVRVMASGLANTTPALLREMVAQLKYIAGQGRVNLKQADDLTKGLLGHSQGGSVQTLRGAIDRLRTEQKTALSQGDTKTAAALGRDVDKLAARLERVEASRAAMLDRAKNAIVNVLLSGFGGVIGAVRGINISPGYYQQQVTQGRSGGGQQNRGRGGAAIPAGNRDMKGPGRAAGGMVEEGQVYTVGEHGTEPFVPKKSGVIAPHGKAGLPVFVTNWPGSDGSGGSGSGSGSAGGTFHVLRLGDIHSKAHRLALAGADDKVHVHVTVPLRPTFSAREAHLANIRWARAGNGASVTID